MDLDDLLGIKNRAESVDDLIQKSNRALDALHLLYADLVRQHGREEGFERLVLHLVKSGLRSVEGTVGLAGLIAILLTKDRKQRECVEDVARFIYNTERSNGTDHWITASEDQRNLTRLKANAYLAIFNGITVDFKPITPTTTTTPQDQPQENTQTQEEK